MRSPWRRPPRSGQARARAPLSSEPRPTAVQGQRLAALRHVEPPVGSVFCLTFTFQSSFFVLAGRRRRASGFLRPQMFPEAASDSESPCRGTSGTRPRLTQLSAAPSCASPPRHVSSHILIKRVVELKTARVRRVKEP